MSETRTQPTRHNHDNGQALPFGRKMPEGQCPRCDELRSGAKPRTLHWVDRAKQQADDDARRSVEIRAHFASARHRSGGCGLVCTYGDW